MSDIYSVNRFNLYPGVLDEKAIFIVYKAADGIWDVDEVSNVDTTKTNVCYVIGLSMANKLRRDLNKVKI